MVIQVHYYDSEGDVIFSNLTPNEFQKIDFSRFYENRIHVENKGFKRQAVFPLDGGIIYFAIYDEQLTSRNFQKYLRIVSQMSNHFKKLGEFSKKNDSLKTRRLKHNLINYNANILQSIYRLVPQDKLIKNGRGQIDLIKSVLQSKPDEASQTILRILKSANMMKSEFDVYEMLNARNSYLDFQNHFIHKITILTLSSFWLDLIEKNINICISKCSSEVRVDYKSVSVAFCHIFDNACKYTLPGTEFLIDFIDSEDSVKVVFEMTSLKIDDADIQKILHENFSGKYAKALGLSGDGIGMNVVKKIVELNNGFLTVRNSIEDSKSQIINGVPYERNSFEIKFQKNSK